MLAVEVAGIQLPRKRETALRNRALEPQGGTGGGKGHEFELTGPVPIGK